MFCFFSSKLVDKAVNSSTVQLQCLHLNANDVLSWKYMDTGVLSGKDIESNISNIKYDPFNVKTPP